MEFTGITAIDEANRVLEQKMNQMVDSFMARVSTQITQQFEKRRQQMYMEAITSYKIIVYNTFQECFYKRYGNNYDINSLNNSITIKVDPNNLRPYLSYDISKLQIKYDFDKDAREFNQNANIEGSYQRLLDATELEAMDEIDFYAISEEEYSSPYEYAEMEMEEPENYKIFHGQRKIYQPAEVYKEALATANERLLAQYKTFTQKIK